MRRSRRTATFPMRRQALPPRRDAAHVAVYRRVRSCGRPGSRSAVVGAARITLAGQPPRGRAWPRVAATRSPWRASLGGAPRAEGHEHGDTPGQVLVATVGVALRLCRAPGRLALQLREFAVDRA